MRLLCVILSILLVFTAVPVFAADSEGLEIAITTVKSRIEIPEELSEFSGSYSYYLGHKTYRLNWESKEDGEKHRAIDISIDDLGNILSYSRIGSDSKKASLPKLSEDQVISAAYGHMAKLNPDIASEFDSNGKIMYGYGVNSSYACVRFDRYINGLPFCNDSVSISVDNDTGELSDLYMGITYVDGISSPDGIIAPEQAAEKFKELSPMEAKYITKDTDEGEAPAAVLAYEPKYSDTMIDARTGEEYVSGYEMTNSEYFAGSAGGTTQDAAAAATETGTFTPSELANLEQIEGLLSETEVRNIAESMTEIPLDGKEFTSCKYFSRRGADGENKYTADLTYSLTETRGETSVREDTFVSLDAVTGALIEVRAFDNANNAAEKPAITEAQALEYAKAFADKYAHDEFMKSNPDLDMADEPVPLEENPYRNSYAVSDDGTEYYYDYVYRFIRVENGFEYPDNDLYIKIDKTNGKVLNFSKNWDDDVTFESPEGMISADEAFEALREKAGINPRYVQKKAENGSISAEVVYSLSEDKPVAVSAVNGALLDYNGTEYKENEKAPIADDISGHYAEAAIEALLGIGVITLSEGETSFRPDEVITQGELLTFVAGLDAGPYSYVTESTDELYKFAYGRGIMQSSDSRDENLPSIREDGVKYIIRSLGYEDIAKMTEIFNTGFADGADITPGMEGYVALAKGFGIIGGNPDNTFAPKAPLTRADAAIMIYNYLTK